MSSSPIDAGSSSCPNSNETASARTANDHDETTISSPPDQTTDEDNTHRCFICLVDELDTDLPTDWVTPCQCSLEGHHSCLLTWVADLEAQGKAVKCPLCKSKIEVVDRWDPAVQLSDTLTRYLSGFSPMILLSFGIGGVVMSSALYGMQALETFAGPEAAVRYIFVEPEADSYLDLVLGRLKRALPAGMSNDGAAAREMLGRQNITASGGATVDWVHFLSLTLVAPALIMNRMPLSEALMVPSSLMYAMFLSDHKTDLFAWPPSGQKALLAFPVARALYFRLHRAVSKNIDRRLAATTASESSNAEEPAAPAAPAREGRQALEDDEDVHHIIDINFDLNLGEGADDNEAAEAAPADQVQNDNAVPVRPNRGLGGISAILNYLAGALMWPTVSYGAGSLLRLALPAAWVTKPSSGPATGILQERWGRSLVGGCLFVVLKDAFFLYVKWRNALNKPHRRIRNVDRRRRQQQQQQQAIR